MAKHMLNGSILPQLWIVFFFCQFHFHFGHAISTKKYSSYSNNVTCIESERRALLEFKGSLVDEWNFLASWTTTEDCCSWNGITCNPRTGHVEKLQLSDYLSGEINSSILNLEHLSYLDLSFNGFREIQIPTFLGSLKNLRYLNLGSASFSGEIPPHLGNLSNLQYLFLDWNGLTANSLQWITGLHSLKALDLSSANLTESVDWMHSISMLPSLSSLSLSGCGLVDTVSPPSIVNLTSLVSLDLGYNDLTNSTIILRFLNLSSQLQVVRLYENSLQGPIPILSKKFTTLTELDLSNNYFNSPLHSLCNQTNLNHLDLGWNQFQGLLPVCLRNLTSLKVLRLSSNTFCGEISSELGHLKQLTTLDLSVNDFKSSIPSSFGQLSELEYLDLGNNQLFGELSESHFSNLKSLNYLYLSENSLLSFVMSSQWVPPFQLERIYLDSVLLGPQFPLWLQTQRNVVDLWMNNASISGVIPLWFMTSCSSIQTLKLSNNNIHGSLTSIPPNVDFLDLSSNIFTVSDISCMTNMSLIRALRLDDNLLVGNIPNDFCNLSSLGVLSLANNQLTGYIPRCFGNLQYLRVLDLANNSLSGHIPRTLGNLTSLWLLHLSRNKFHGVLPSSLKNLKSLATFDLGENQLTGTIPEWIGKELSTLLFLILQSNNFYGNISIHLCQLASLQILNLAENNLIGEIPRCLGNLSMMISPGYVLSDYSSSYYIEALSNVIKGQELKYSSNLGSVCSISLSGNNIHGEIPNELMILEGLLSLNLSNNKISGRIPENIGNLKNLESLDLAMNRISGTIPQSLANIDTLSFLNLSFNNLVGRVPSGSHFDTLIVDQTTYEGNSGLCGKLIAKSCPDDASSEEKEPAAVHQNIDDALLEISWFYAGIAPGFAVGLVGVFCVLHFNRSWRHAYFGFVQKLYDRVCVTFAVQIFYFFKKFN